MMPTVDHSFSSLTDPAAAALAAQLSPQGLCLSRRRVITWCNDRFAMVFGRSRDEIEGHSFEQLYPTRAEFLRIGERGEALMRQDGYLLDERLMRLGDGRLQWFRARGHAVDNEDPFALASWVFEPIASATEPEALSRRQHEILGSLLCGMTSKQTAQSLGLSHRTVEKYRAQLLVKYKAPNTAALVQRVLGQR
jgi:DNA-binding CsgD family transcriptional regulator